MLNALGRFWAAAAAPVLLNIILIAAMTIVALAGGDIGTALAWSVPVAGIAQLALVVIAAHRAGIRLRPTWPTWTPEMKRLAIVAAPAALAGGVVQVNLLVGRQVASWFDGAVAWLNYADRLYQLPLGVVGIAIGVVLLPDLSRKLAGRRPGGRGVNAVNRATEFSLALTLPAAVALVAIPLPLISVLFERGAFTGEDSAATAAALAIYGLGLPAFVLQKVLSPIYFAREDTRTPFRFALVSMVVNAVIAIGLAPVMGYLAAALGTTLAGWAMLALLYRGARRIDGGVEPDARLARVFPRILAASLVMGAVLYGAAWLLGEALTAPGLRYAALCRAGGAGRTLLRCDRLRHRRPDPRRPSPIHVALSRRNTRARGAIVRVETGGTSHELPCHRMDRRRIQPAPDQPEGPAGPGGVHRPCHACVGRHGDCGHDRARGARHRGRGGIRHGDGGANFRCIRHRQPEGGPATGRRGAARLPARLRSTCSGRWTG